MLPFWLLPLGFFALSRGRTIKYKKPVNSKTGLIFNCSKIEILNKQVAYRTIDFLIEDFRRKNRELKTINVFDFILNKLDCTCYKKMKSRKLSQKEKIIVSLLFILVFNRLAYFVNEEELISNFQNKDHAIFMYLLDLSENDHEIIDEVNDQFNVSYSYP